MKIDKTNDIPDYQKRNMAYTAAGLGAGAVAGGTFGYLQKPWIKDGKITDSFVKEVEKNIHKQYIQDCERFIKVLIKLSETGNLDNNSKDTLVELFGKGEYEDKNLTPDKIKEDANSTLELLRASSNAKNNNELIQKVSRMKMEMATGEYLNNKIQELKSLKIDNNISVEDIVKLYKENILSDFIDIKFKLSEGESLKDYFQNQINKNGKNTVVNELKKFIAELMEYYQEELTEYKKYIKDISGKKIKDLPANANGNTKRLYNSIKKTISEMNWKNAGKWAGIGAVALGAIGLGTAFLTGKKPADLPAEQIKQ